MRIVGGKWRGRVIEAPQGRGTTRPTTDRTREAVTSSILSAAGLNLSGKRVLDAFAGSGALGFELLSRGAAYVTFVDKDRKTADLIRKNARTLGAGAQEARIVCGDALCLSARKTLPGGPFDIVLLDPPYAVEAQRIAEFLVNVDGADALTPRALVVYEHHDKAPGMSVGGVDLIKSKRYGIARVDLMIKSKTVRAVPDGEKSGPREGESSEQH